MRNPKFHKLLKEIAELHDAKNNDYSTSEDALSNFRLCENFGIPAWKGCLVRMSDKWSRITQLSKKEASVKSETIVDTLKDLAVYSLICTILYEESK